LVIEQDDSRRGRGVQQVAEPESLSLALSAQLEVEAELRRRLRLHGLIDQAVGVLIARLGCGPGEAFAQLCEIERRSGGGLWSVAAELVGDTAGAAGESGGTRVAEIPDPGVLAMQRSADADELARLLVDQTAGRPAVWPGAAGAAVALLQSDGALEIVGAAGLPASWVSQWRRIPPAVDCLLTIAMREGQPAWSDEPRRPGTRPARGAEPHLSGNRTAGVRVAVPLRDGGRLLGGVEMAWAEGCLVAPEQRREVAALAQYVGPAVVRTLLVGGGRQRHPASHPGRAPAWLQEIVDAVPEPMAALAPIRDNDTDVADLEISCANRAAVELLGSGSHDIAGRRLLEVIPWAAASGAFVAIRQAFSAGAPYRDDAHAYVLDTGGVRHRATIGVTASRIADDILLLGLRPGRESAGGPASAATAPDSRVIQRLSRAGWWEWDVAAGQVRWTPAALMILGARGPAALASVDVPPFAPHPDDAAAVDRAMTALGRDGRASEVEFRILQAGGAVRHIRLAGEPVPGADGAPVLVTGVVQDITDRRRAEVALEVAQVQVAAQRGRVDAERQLAALLQQIIMPVEPVRLPAAAGVDIAARYRPASAAAGIGGDWYGVFPLPGSGVLLTIGDVAGHGMSAASAMAQLHHALHGLAHIGAGPAELLGYLNVMACALPTFTLASACCALYDPADRQLRWANAGHPSPVLVRAAATEPLAALGGTMLGADSEGSYSEAVLDVRVGDVLLLYTDGLVERRHGGEDDITPLLAAAACPEDDLESYVDRVLSGARSDTDDDTCLIAVRFG
jgi:PAS domain S-box-containing protein